MARNTDLVVTGWMPYRGKPGWMFPLNAAGIVVGRPEQRSNAPIPAPQAPSRASGTKVVGTTNKPRVDQRTPQPSLLALVQVVMAQGAALSVLQAEVAALKSAKPTRRTAKAVAQITKAPEERVVQPTQSKGEWPEHRDADDAALPF